MKVDRAAIVLLSATIIVSLFSVPALSNAKYCQSRYVKKPDNNKQSLLLIFVHGITGDCITTWTNETVDTYWPKMAGKDPVFQGAHIYVYQYPSYKRNPSPSLGQIVSNMNLQFWEDDVTKNYQQVAFIAHSFGGLVVRAYVKQHLDSTLAAKRRFPIVRFLYLLGTPHNEVKKAIVDILAVASGNEQFRDVTGVTPFVSNLIEDWETSQVLSTVPVYCGYEKRSTGGVGILVDPKSATRACSHKRAFYVNHQQLAKPNDPSAHQHLYLQKMFAETGETWVKQRQWFRMRQ